MNKTFISIALSLIFMMSMVPAAVFADYEGASSWAVPELNKAADFSTDGAEKFADDNMISAYARDGVYYCSKNNLLKGVGSNKFNPQGNSSREAAIIVCLRAYELYKQASVPQTPASQQGPQAGPVFTNEVLKQNIEKLDSYRRIIRTVTAATATTKQWESIKEFAYIRNPISRYMKLDFPDSGSSYLEEIIIGSKMWNRASKDEVWTEWNEWYAEKPATLEYDLSIQPYSINYGKLTYTEAGTEKINGINCIKYTVSGTYSDEFSDERSGDKYPITLSASGTIWIADDTAIKTAIIRQRIKVNVDITYNVGKLIHSVSEDVIEDDVMDINSVKISPPSNAIKGN